MCNHISMKNTTLILNKQYIPIHIATWQRAMSLLYQGAALSLDDEYNQYDFDQWVDYTKKTQHTNDIVTTTNFSVLIPSILVLQRYKRLPNRDVKYTRENIFHRDNNICTYCGNSFNKSELTIDHIVPKSRGGTNDWKNIITSCKPCNGKKADKTPNEANMKMLYKPREPKWTDTLTKRSNTPKIKKSWKPFLKFVGITEE